MISNKNSERRGRILESVGEDLATLMRKDPKLVKNLEDARKATAPITSELKAAGFHVEIIEDLVNNPECLKRLPAAVPILLRWLAQPVDVKTKAQIVHVLAAQNARPAATEVGHGLLNEFERMDPALVDLKWSIADAIESLRSVRDKGILKRVLKLIQDKRHGRARQMLVVALGHTREQRVVDLLITLLSEEDVALNAIMALRKLKAKRARPFVERFLTRGAPWVRAEAKKFFKATA